MTIGPVITLPPLAPVSSPTIAEDHGQDLSFGQSTFTCSAPTGAGAFIVKNQIPHAALWQVKPEGQETTPRVQLTTFLPKHAETYRSWLLTPDYLHYHNNQEPPSVEEIARQIENGDFYPTPEQGSFLIFDGERPVGWIRFFRPESVYDAFELGMNIGTTENRGRGVGFNAQTLLIDYLFANHPTRRVQWRTIVGNKPVEALTEKFPVAQHEGVLRQALRIGDQWVDISMFSVIRDEWLAWRKL